MSKRLVITLALGACAVAGALVFKAVRSAEATPIAPDIPLADLLRPVPSALRFEPRKMPEAENGWVAVALAAKHTPTSIPDGEAPRIASESLIGEGTKYDAPMAELSKALQETNFSVETLEGDASPFAVVPKLRLSGTFLGNRALARLERGDLSGTVGDLRDSLKISVSILKSGPPLDYAVIASSLLTRACRDVRVAALHPKVTAKSLEELREVLPAIAELDDSFKKSIRSDLYWFVREEVVRLKGPGMNSRPDNPNAERDYQSGWNNADAIAASLLEGHPKPFDREDTVARASEIYVELLKNIDRSWADQFGVFNLSGRLVTEWPESRLRGGRGTTDREKAEIARKRPGLLKSTNPYGRLAVWYFLPVSYQMCLAPFRNRADVDATRIVLALRQFELERKSLPKRLEELIATGHLAELPNDPFLGKPFRYEPATRRVWSAGPDGIDDGGIGGGALAPTSRDFVWTF